MGSSLMIVSCESASIRQRIQFTASGLLVFFEYSMVGLIQGISRSCSKRVEEVFKCFTLRIFCAEFEYKKMLSSKPIGCESASFKLLILERRARNFLSHSCRTSSSGSSILRRFTLSIDFSRYECDFPCNTVTNILTCLVKWPPRKISSSRCRLDFRQIRSKLFSLFGCAWFFVTDGSVSTDAIGSAIGSGFTFSNL